MEYDLENDFPLMKAIEYFVKLSNNENYKYKFIEIIKRIAYEDIVFLSDLMLLEKEFKCPIRKQLIKGSSFYLGSEIKTLAGLNRYLGEGNVKSEKLCFNRLRNAIVALT